MLVSRSTNGHVVQTTSKTDKTEAGAAGHEIYSPVFVETSTYALPGWPACADMSHSTNGTTTST